MIPTLTLCSLDCFRRMVDVHNYIIRAGNILTFIYLVGSSFSGISLIFFEGKYIASVLDLLLFEEGVALVPTCIGRQVSTHHAEQYLDGF